MPRRSFELIIVSGTIKVEGRGPDVWSAKYFVGRVLTQEVTDNSNRVTAITKLVRPEIMNNGLNNVELRIRKASDGLCEGLEVDRLSIPFRKASKVQKVNQLSRSINIHRLPPLTQKTVLNRD